MSWTDDRVERLKKLWTEGHSASQIAGELGGVTRNAVIGKVHRLGLSGRATPSRPPRRTIQLQRPRPVIRPPKSVTRLPPPPPPPVEAQPLPNGEFATVLTLSDRLCKWPIGDPGEAGFRFCGRKNGAAGPYCEAHARLAFQPAKRRRREGEDAKAALDAIAAARRLAW